MVANSNQPGMVAEGFDQISESYHHVLGPIRVHFFSKYLLRGGYLRMALTMPAVEQTIRVDNVQMMLEQHINLQSSREPERSERRLMSIPLWSMRDEGNAPLDLRAGKTLSLIRQARLNAEMVRSSTNPFSQTGIRVSHSIAALVRYSANHGELTEWKVSFPARLSSCACSIENLQ